MAGFCTRPVPAMPSGPNVFDPDVRNKIAKNEQNLPALRNDI